MIVDFAMPFHVDLLQLRSFRIIDGSASHIYRGLLRMKQTNRISASHSEFCSLTMDITVARTFLEIVKTGSFVRAAANLNITQTAVSARVRVLEEQLDRQLFVRNKAGARLDPGRRPVPPLRDQPGPAMGARPPRRRDAGRARECRHGRRRAQPVESAASKLAGVDEERVRRCRDPRPDRRHRAPSRPGPGGDHGPRGRLCSAVPHRHCRGAAAR